MHVCLGVVLQIFYKLKLQFKKIVINVHIALFLYTVSIPFVLRQAQDERKKIILA